MYVLLDVQRNTDLVELLCIAKSRGINYDVVEDFEQILDIYRPFSVSAVPDAHLFPTPEKTPVRRKPTKKAKPVEKAQAPVCPDPLIPRLAQGGMETFQSNEQDHFKFNSNFNEGMSYQYQSNNNNNLIINKENSRVCTSCCSKCGISMPYTTQKSLMIHARTHFKKMGYACSDCGALFFQYVAASNHISLCHMGTLAVVRDILTKEDMRELEKCMRECFTTDCLYPVKATYIPKLNMLPKPLLQVTDSNSSVGSDVICIDDSDDDTVDPRGVAPLLREGR